MLIYAFRTDTAQHSISKSWLNRLILGDAQFGVSPLVLSAVVRITTNPRIFKLPSKLSEVLSYCDNLLHQPHGEILQPGERHWRIFSRLCIATGTRGPRITDAWFAPALAINMAVPWITFDRDYARFVDLDWREPVA